MQSDNFKVKNDQGQETTYTRIMDFENNGKNYIVYTDGTTSEDGTLEVLASVVGDSEELLPIESDEEWKMIEEIVQAAATPKGDE